MFLFKKHVGTDSRQVDPRHLSWRATAVGGSKTPFTEMMRSCSPEIKCRHGQIEQFRWLRLTSWNLLELVARLDIPVPCPFRMSSKRKNNAKSDANKKHNTHLWTFDSFGTRCKSICLLWQVTDICLWVWKVPLVQWAFGDLINPRPWM